MRRLALSLILAAVILPGAAFAQAPKPLYRDPVFDGAADASIVRDRAGKQWKMFYTARRASLSLPDPKDVAWVHETAIGVATSKDGLSWRYEGTAKIPAACTGATLWAPEVFVEGGLYHMWLSVVPGTFHRWGVPEATAKIVHLTSKDMKAWTCADTLDLGSDRVIDAGVIKKPGGGYRLWFKDERANSRIFAADSADLKTWTRQPAPIGDFAAEGPKAFLFQGSWWMIVDGWRGLIVLKSDDAQTWTRQTRLLLDRPGSRLTDLDLGHHADVVVNNGRAYLYYFVQQGREAQAASDPTWAQRSVIQVSELYVSSDGTLRTDRDAIVRTPLK